MRQKKIVFLVPMMLSREEVERFHREGYLAIEEVLYDQGRM